MLKVSVSLWSADLTNLGNEVKRLEDYADFFHFDVADGHFASTFLFFPDLIKALREKTKLPFDVHLIIKNPGKFIDNFIEAGADIVTVYAEADCNLEDTIERIKDRGAKASVALRPETPITTLEPILDSLDMVVIMGTEVDVRGQSLFPSTDKRIRALSSLIAGKGLKIDIEADGGIRKETVPGLVEAGASVIVAGSLVFNNDLKQIFNWLRRF